MIKLATVFSGIGAIEHALNRMGLDNEIVFACDNGDVNIFSKKIDQDIVMIEKEIELLNKFVINVNENKYKKELVYSLKKVSDLYRQIKKEIDFDNYAVIQTVASLLKKISETKNIKQIRKREYTSFLKKIAANQNNHINLKMYTIMYAVEVINDFYKDNSLQSLGISKKYRSKDNIEWKSYEKDLIVLRNFIDQINAKKVLKKIKDVCERLGMLYEKIKSQEVSEHLEKITSYDKKKEYIDLLYKDKESLNKVKTSYLKNYKLEDRNFYWNISFLDGNEYKNKVDLFVGGSPCQSFSLVGKQRGLEDTRGTLFYEYARLIKEIKPKIFIYENVKAILSNDGGRTWETISKVFTDLDYTWKYSVLNAKNYGIPQNRERVFVVGFRNDLKLKKEFEFPKPIPLNTKMRDYLVDNVSGKYYLPKKGVDYVTSDLNLRKKYTQIDGDIALCQTKNQQFNWHGDFIFVEENKNKEKTLEELKNYFLSKKVKKYVLSSGTKGFYSKPEINLDIARPLLTTMHKMHRAGIDNYVTTEGRIRKLTPRECLRLMGFSDSFKIAVSDTNMYQQAGNSIVVDVLIAIMNKIIEVYPQIAR